MVKEIILDNDEVSLPGVGTFVAEVVPSTFSDKGYTINPPYRRLSFRQRESADTRLVDFYASSNGVDRDAATSIIVRFLAELKETLQQKKTIVFPELGRLRATKENNFFFVPDEDLNIYPDGFGLMPVSLKTHVETEDDLEAAVSSIQLILNQQVPAAPVVEAPVEPAPEPVPAPVVEPEEPDAPIAEAPAVPVVEPAAPVEEVLLEAVPATPEPAVPAEPAPEPVREAVVEPEEPVIPVAEEPAVPAAEEEPAAPVAQVTEKPAAPAVKAPAASVEPERKGLHWSIIALLVIIAAALIFFGGFLLLAHIAPDFIDSLLYTPEELQIINHFK